MDWKMYYRGFDFLKNFVVVTALVLLVSACHHRNRDGYIPDYNFAVPGSSIEIINSLSDMNAEGLGKSWFDPRRFPADQLSSIPDANAPYVWYYIPFKTGTRDSLYQFEFSRRDSNEQILAWSDGELLSPLFTDSTAELDILGPAGHCLIIRRTLNGPVPLMKLKLLKRSQDDESVEETAAVRRIVQSINYPRTDFHAPRLIYKVFLRNFTQNGTFDGLENRLNHITALGANGLILMPMHPMSDIPDSGLCSPYLVKRHFSTDSNKGSKEQLQSMLDAADSLHVSVYLEAMLNLTAPDHYYSQNSPEMYLGDAPEYNLYPSAGNHGKYLNLQEDASESFVREYLKYWVTDFGFSGYMLLNSWELAAVPEIQQILSVQKRKSVIIGDYTLPTVEVASELCDMNMASDFYSAMVEAFANHNPDTLFTVLDQEANFPATPVHYIENTFTDKAWTVFGDALYAATFLDVVLPGVPLIYSGQELLRAPKQEVDARTALNWRRQDRQFREILSKCLYRKPVADKNGGLELTRIEAGRDIFAVRIGNAGKYTTIIANLSEYTHAIPMPPVNQILFSDEHSSSDSLTLTLASYGYILAN